MALTYSTFGTTLVAMMAGRSDDTNYVAVLPSIIDYAEQRIYRDLDLLSTVVRDRTATMTANSRNLTLPSAFGRFTVVSAINVLSSSVRVAQLEPVSLEFLDAAWASETAAASSTIPQYFAMVTDQTIALGPPPGSALGVEVVGYIRPAALSVSNTTTYLTTYLPDLFLAAAMIFAAAYQKNFGAQSDDKDMAMSWEKQYNLLLSSASLEEHRKRFQSVSWTSKSPSPVAIPQRG